MTKTKISEILTRHVSRIEKRIEGLEIRSNRLSKIRIAYFLFAIILAYIAYDAIVAVNGLMYLGLITGMLIGFFILVDRHRRITDTLDKFKIMLGINQEHLARLSLNWENIPYHEYRFEKQPHPFAKDLNLVGKGSLLHLLDTMIYPESRNRLVSWLMKESPVENEILKRQKQVQELSELKGFRDMIRVIGDFSKKKENPKDWSTSRMMDWLNLPQKTGFKLPLVVLSVLSTHNITTGILLLLGYETQLFLVFGVVAYLLIYKFNGEKINGLFDSAFQVEQILDRFKNILIRIQKFQPAGQSEIAKLLHPFHKKGENPSGFLKKVQKLMSKASIQANQLLWPLVNITVPWDLYYAMKLEGLKKELHQKLTVWLDAFYELEALNSLACFKFLNPGYTFPTIESESELLFKATELGHPLIDPANKISNNFSIKTGEDLFLITGSNMAGKSTFLRTVAINLILANAGAPVDAGSMYTRLFRIFTSINVVDSLGDGLSHFYAEVKRLKYLMDELDRTSDSHPLFYFVDEIYRGTNNRERYTGSAAFLRFISEKPGVGMVSSHDLELADLEHEIANLRNLHFSESIKDGKMSFSYKLHYGPCPSTNALKIMEMEGLPVK